jgi:hypothetical protein
MIMPQIHKIVLTAILTLAFVLAANGSPYPFSCDMASAGTDSTRHPVIFFSGNFPSDLKVTCTVYDVKSGRGRTVKVHNPRQGFIVPESLPEDAPLKSFIRVVVHKPEGYNVFVQTEEASKGWQQGRLELRLRNEDRVYLEIKPLFTFDFFYLDVSSLKQRDKAITEIDLIIENIIKEGDSFCLYVSNADREMVARKPETYQKTLRAAGSLNPDPPIASQEDLKILGLYEWPLAIERYDLLRFHFYIPELTYKLHAKKLIVNLLKQIDNRRWEVFINTDHKAEPIYPASNNYHYKNILKNK